jgi:hypothetical protein
MDRESRRITNSTQASIREIDYYPSHSGVPEGELVISAPKNKPLRLYKKLNGLLWKTDLSYDGNQIVEKDLKVNGNINLSNKLITKNYPAFRATATSNQALSDGTWTTITFASSVYDNGSNFDLSNEYFVAPVKGIYFFTAQVLYEDSDSEEMNANERLDVRIYNITDSAHLGQGLYHIKHDFPADIYLAVHCTTQSELSAGDQISVGVYNTTGETINTYVGTQTHHSYFTGHLICAL